MSQFGDVLEEEMRRQKLTALEMSARMGVGDSHISAFINNRRQSCNVETLMKMVNGISEDAEVKARLLEGYFRDQCLERYKPWISVDPERPWSGTILREAPPELETEEASEAAAYLISAIRNHLVPHKIIESLAAIVRFLPGRDKFRVVIQDLGKFAKEELERPKPKA